MVYEVEYLFNTFHFLSGNDCNLGNPSPGMWPLLGDGKTFEEALGQGAAG